MQILESEWQPTLKRQAVADLLVRTAGVQADDTPDDEDEEGERQTGKKGESIAKQEKLNVDLYRFYTDKKSKSKRMAYFKSPEEMEQMLNSK